MEISVNAIVVLILAITFLSLGLVFMKGMLGKMFLKLDEQISQEPDPPNPTLSKSITLSRNPVQATEGTVEVVKLSVLNPSGQDWISRKFIRTDNLCSKADGICFIDTDDTTEKCNTESNAKNNDPDCATGLFTGMDCKDNGEKSPCLISNIEGDLYCPNYNEESRDPNCAPKEGAEIYLTCDEKAMSQPFTRKIDSIKSGNYKTNILLLRLNKNIPNDQYLCQIRIFAEDKEYMEDLVVRIENG